jgi:hypothetical protein
MKIGDKVIVNHNNEQWEDIIRGFFEREVVLEPYDRNKYIPAAILTVRSNADISEIKVI